MFDMDYHFRLVQRGGAGISVKEYRDWRASGTAFRWDEEGEEQEFEPNLSLMSSLIVTRLEF